MLPDPNLVYIPVVLLDDRRLSARDQATLMLLITLADNSPRGDYNEHALAHGLGVTTQTVRKWLARLEGFGYLINHKDWVELHDDLVLTQDSLLMADLPPLSDEESVPGGGHPRPRPFSIPVRQAIWRRCHDGQDSLTIAAASMVRLQPARLAGRGIETGPTAR